MKGKFMKQDKKIEEILLNDESYENFVNSKLEKDFENEISSPFLSTSLNFDSSF